MLYADTCECWDCQVQATAAIIPVIENMQLPVSLHHPQIKFTAAAAVAVGPQEEGSGEGAGGVAALQALRLHCSLGWPLSAVVDTTALELFNAVLLFLLQVLPSECCQGSWCACSGKPELIPRITPA